MNNHPNPIQMIPLRSLQVGEHEQRLRYDDEAMTDLIQSIRQEGILQPLIVRPAGDKYLIIEGHRRRYAADCLGLPELPCQVRPDDAAGARRVAFITNFIRANPSPIELALAIGKASESGETALSDIAHALHRSVDWVKRQLALLDWPEDVLAAIHRGQLSVSAAAPLAAIDDETYRKFLLEHACANGATARTTAAWLQQYQATVPMHQAINADPLAAPTPRAPIIPQQPCFGCSTVHRADELSHLPLCVACIRRVRAL